MGPLRVSCGRKHLATGRYALANAVTADGLRGRGWYGPVAVRQPSLGGNYLFHCIFRPHQMGDRVVTLANVVTADGLHGCGWYGPVAVRQSSLGGNYLFDIAFSGRIRWATGWLL